MAYRDMNYHYRRQFPAWPSPFDPSHPLDGPPATPRITLAGSLDPTTGIFYRTPEHPRLRTAQACEKCRSRKAKCSGDHPSCARCVSRGLVCEYAKEGRLRGNDKAKVRATSTASNGSHSSQSPQNSPPSLAAYPTADAKKSGGSRYTALSPRGDVKSEPLSTCLPLSLQSSSSNGRSYNRFGQLSVDTDLHSLGVTEDGMISSDGKRLPRACSTQPTSMVASPTYSYPDSGYSDSYASQYTRRSTQEYDQDAVGWYTGEERQSVDYSATRRTFSSGRAYMDHASSSSYVLGGGSECQGQRSDIASFHFEPRRQSNARSLHGSGSTGSVESGSTPASAVSGSFPLFSAQWSASPHIHSPTPQTHLAHSAPYASHEQNMLALSADGRSQSAFPHPPRVSTAYPERNQSRHHQYQATSITGPYDMTGRFQPP
ncbi:hypothetical protein R3P38DRAFT_3173545 [Favolaschia claudopus]|uniref:Zn(2)-C6 fungal-type domain-containing protein n=1 Tax=Favolaschia claudopus TaxID=2862362 RepID=A0AAW0DGW4_9AGAR